MNILGKVWNFIKRVHEFVSYVLLTMVLAMLLVYVYEQNLDFEDYISYYNIMTEVEHFDVGNDIRFYSFAKSARPADIEWTERTYCIGPDGNAANLYASPTKATKFFAADEYPDHIWSLLVSLNTSGTDKRIANETLRQWSRESGNPSWAVDMATPAVGSNCQTTHTIVVTTPIFSLDKEFIFTSLPWDYGVAKYGRQ